MSIRIDEIVSKGFIPQMARVRLIVWWKKIDESEKAYSEIKIILPDIHLMKKDRNTSP